MKKFITRPTKVRGLGNLHTQRNANEYTEEDCNKSSLGNHPFEGIDNNEYELTSTDDAKRLTLTTPAQTVYLGQTNYTLIATFTDENGNPITTGTNGASFFINGNQIASGVNFSNGTATYTGTVTASNPGTWAITAKTTQNNIVYTSNQILMSAIKRPTQITYLSTVRQGTNYMGRLIDLTSGDGLKNQTVTIRISRSTGESKTYTINTDTTGYFTLPINLNLGEYWFKISYAGTGVYEAYTTDTYKVTVNNEYRQSTFTNISNEVPRTDYFTAQLVDRETGQPIPNQTVNMTLSRTNTQSTSNENSTRTYAITTDSEGYCKLQINLSEDTYLFDLEYLGNETYEPTSTHNQTLKVTTNDKETTYIMANDTVTQYSNYTGVLVDSDGDPIPNANILITMCRSNGEQCKTYGTGEADAQGNVDALITTDSNGQFGKYITLSPGTYRFTSVFSGDDHYLPATTGTIYVTVIEKVKETSHIVADTSVYTGSSINGFLLDDSGEGIENRNITINIARYTDVSQNKDYNVTTTTDGAFSLPITLAPEQYYFTYTFDGSSDAEYDSCTLGPLITSVLAGTIPTSLSLVSSTVTNGGYLQFQLLDENDTPIEDCEIPITLYREYYDGGELITQQVTYYSDRNGLTNSNGIVNCLWSITPQSGSTYYASAIFKGGDGYMSSTVAKTELTISTSTTTLTMTRSPSSSVVDIDTNMLLTAQLLDGNNNPLQSMPVNLSLTHSLIDGEITVTNNGTVVTATVVDEDNTPIPNLNVGFYNADTNALISTQTTDNNGVCSYDCSGASKVYCQSASTSGYEQLTSEEITIQPTQVIIYEDNCDVDNISTTFGSSLSLVNNGRTTATLYSKRYKIANSVSSGEGMLPINALDGYTGDFCIEFTSKGAVDKSVFIGFAIRNSTSDWISEMLNQKNKKVYLKESVNGTVTSTTEDISISDIYENSAVKHKIEVYADYFVYTLTIGSSMVLFSKTENFSTIRNNSTRYGICTRGTASTEYYSNFNDLKITSL